MAALPAKMYRDPAQVLLDAEAETCRGCKHRHPWRGAAYCDNQLVRNLLAEKRCDKYEEET